MSDMQRTPGPWHAVPPSTKKGASINWIVASDAPPAPGYDDKTLVSVIRDRGPGRVNATAYCEADARLIAAAPDLLDAAVSVIEAASAYREAYLSENPGRLSPEEAQAQANKAMDRLRGAVAKAEGAPR